MHQLCANLDICSNVPRATTGKDMPDNVQEKAVNADDAIAS
jgi:hypothetical protein